MEPPLIECGRNPLEPIHVRFSRIEPDEYHVPLADSYTLRRVAPQDPLDERQICSLLYDVMDAWRW